MAHPIEFLINEWREIWRAKVTFAVVLAIIAGGVYWALDWRYGGIVADLQERISLRDDQIQALKDKVGTASPIAIKAKIESLERQVTQLTPRHLTNAQLTKMTNILDADPGAIVIDQDMAATDARLLAGGLDTAFEAAGWHVQNEMVMGPSNPPPHGIALIIPDPSNLTPRQKAIASALTAIGLKFDIQRGTEGSLGPGGSPADAGILVSQKVL